MGGGHSAAAGFTLGPAVTFGFIAGRHMAAADPNKTIPKRNP